MDRYWLLTWTTYGTWLPGDARGFVSAVDDGTGGTVIHNISGTPFDADWHHLREYAKSRLDGGPVLLDSKEASIIADQLHETARHRGWQLTSIAIMRNHIHVVVGVAGDPPPETLLRDFKSYASRALNQALGFKAKRWTESGSRRRLKTDDAILSAT
ncbi:MAG: transposase, partial [Planctomycetales bacterium]|nr:transposase [Planctomycetales bacterium]